MMKKIIAVSIASLLLVPVYIGATHESGQINPELQDAGQRPRYDLLGECRVPIYHTDFQFPPQGGAIVRASDGEMYFMRTYLPGCENAAVGYEIVRGGQVILTEHEPAVQGSFAAPRSGRCE